ncbi:MAG: RNA-binding S4 domain-containing protein [Actinomycetota bacterium]|nr:RNA-binding S4 domain-containing protein [Actinomycetota bacterium]
MVSLRAGTRLDQLLKYINIVSTGGEAKSIIQSGEVSVNGKVETRRGYKLKEGDTVDVKGVSLKVSLKE